MRVYFSYVICRDNEGENRTNDFGMPVAGKLAFNPKQVASVSFKRHHWHTIYFMEDTEYDIIPVTLRSRVDMTPTTKLVVAYLLNRSKVDNYYISPSSLANACGISIDTASRELKRLEGKQCVEFVGRERVKHSTKHYNKYSLNRQRLTCLCSEQLSKCELNNSQNASCSEQLSKCELNNSQKANRTTRKKRASNKDVLVNNISTSKQDNIETIEVQNIETIESVHSVQEDFIKSPKDDRLQLDRDFPVEKFRKWFRERHPNLSWTTLSLPDKKILCETYTFTFPYN